MARPKIYHDTHFAFTHRKNSNGSIDIIAYRNEWDPVKKRSFAKERRRVGTLNPSTGRVLIGKTYLKTHPEMEGKTFIYKDNQLIEKDISTLPEEADTTEEQPQESFYDDVVSWGATYACLNTAKALGLPDSLKSIFGQEDATKLLLLAVYQYITAGAMMNFEEWAPGVWLPHAEGLTSQRISELLSKVTQEKMTKYFKERFDLANKRYEQLNLGDGYHFLALDSTAISTYSESIEDAAYGHAKQNPELRQVNYTLGVDYLTGDVVYGYQSQGSITDKTIYPELLEDMKSHGFDLGKTVLVTDRGYESIHNIQKLLNSDLCYICGVPLTETSVKQRIIRHWEALNSSGFYNADLEVFAHTVREKWYSGSPQVAGDYWLHIYRDPRLAQLQSSQLLAKVDKVLKAKEAGKEADPELWREVKRFLIQTEKGEWFKNIKQLDEALKYNGCFAIRTNCISNPFDALIIYRRRNIVETAFRLFKVLNDGRRMYAGNSTYLGKLFIYTLAEAIRFAQMVTTTNNSERLGIKKPGDSMETVKMILSRLKAKKGSKSQNWRVQKVNKKARDTLDLLGISKIPDYLQCDSSQ
jgi:transposase